MPQRRIYSSAAARQRAYRARRYQREKQEAEQVAELVALARELSGCRDLVPALRVLRATIEQERVQRLPI